MAKALDELSEFEQFKNEVLPRLRKEVAKGTDAEKIYEMCQAHLAARAVTIALTEKDTARALSAIKEALDRGKGKAKERQEITHKYEELKDEELDAILMSEIGDMDESDSKKQH